MFFESRDYYDTDVLGMPNNTRIHPSLAPKALVVSPVDAFLSVLRYFRTGIYTSFVYGMINDPITDSSIPERNTTT